MYIIVGLGNPTKQYEETRHNAGFLLLDAIRNEWNFPPFSPQEKYFAEISLGTWKGNKILLVKPQTYMNLSGKSVSAVAHYYRVATDHILILHDDKDFSLGEIRIARDSSSAGHRGVQNIFDTFSTKNISRIRLGIGPVREHVPTDAFVLERFTSEEKEKLLSSKESVAKEIHSFLSSDSVHSESV